MKEQNLVTIAQELIEAFNANDAQRFKKHLTTNVVYDEVGTQRKLQGADAWVKTWEEWRRALPDVKGTVTNAVASGNTVVQEITWKGTHDGPLNLPDRTISPSGKRQVTRASHVLVFEGDKVKECRHYFDMLSLLQQVGALPMQAKATAG
jgi:steroid delta-isomerase-like uncharacterized protein